MLTRQKIVIRLLGDGGGTQTKLELTKLCFLLAKEGRSEHLKTFYEFVPYKFGPYSFTLAHELGNLAKDGLLVTQNETVELTAKGKKVYRQALEARLARDIELLWHNYSELDQKELIDRVYKKYPWFTVNSQFSSKRKMQKSTADCANYTIGYQSFQVDGLLNKLLECGIGTLIDTRSNPVSRRYGFHKSSLSKLCSSVGIVYSHRPEVGIPSSWRQELETDAEYRKLFHRYEVEILPAQTEAVREIAWQMSDGPAALLCRESEPAHCHRTILANSLSKINGLKIVDLLAPVAEDRLLIKFQTPLV